MRTETDEEYAQIFHLIYYTKNILHYDCRANYFLKCELADKAFENESLHFSRLRHQKQILRARQFATYTDHKINREAMRSGKRKDAEA